MGNNSYNQIKDIITDIFDELENKELNELTEFYCDLEKHTEDTTTVRNADLFNQSRRKLTIACRTAKNHALNDFETTYKDCKILLENL